MRILKPGISQKLLIAELNGLKFGTLHVRLSSDLVLYVNMVNFLVEHIDIDICLLLCNIIRMF